MHDAVAHTAEHALIGSLQKSLGQILLVTKVEHRQNGINTAFIKIPKLDFENLIKAQMMTNVLISEGRNVSSRIFDSLEIARREYPNLRANEDRISGKVRVIEIQDHDIAACSREHVKNLSECRLLLISRMSKSGDEYEIDFVVGTAAIQLAVEMSAKLLEACSILGTNPASLQTTILKLKEEHNVNNKKLKSLTQAVLDQLHAINLTGKYGELKLFAGSYSDLSDKQMLEFVGELITANKDVVVCISNASKDSASIILARTESAGINIDMRELFARHAKGNGKGGGKPHFVTGAVTSGFASILVQSIAAELRQDS